MFRPHEPCATDVSYCDDRFQFELWDARPVTNEEFPALAFSAFALESTLMVDGPYVITGRVSLVDDGPGSVVRGLLRVGVHVDGAGFPDLSVAQHAHVCFDDLWDAVHVAPYIATESLDSGAELLRLAREARSSTLVEALAARQRVALPIGA
jgi:hypothetical protein